MISLDTYRPILAGIVLGLLSGCAHINTSASPDANWRVDVAARTDSLEQALLALGPTVNPKEAARVANVTTTHAMLLAGDYRMLPSPVAHNILVNAGLRDRGLCIHWAEDMLRMLMELDLQSLDLHWARAEPRNAWRLQHSAPVVTPRGGAFENGLVLDGWRRAGRLYFETVSADQRYDWVPVYGRIAALADGTYPPK